MSPGSGHEERTVNMHRMRWWILAAVTGVLTIGCADDRDRSLGPAAAVSGSQYVGHVDLLPDVPPGDHIAKGSCGTYHAKVYDDNVPANYLPDHLVDWFAWYGGGTLFSYDASYPYMSRTTHPSSDAVRVCGLDDGFAAIGAQSNPEGIPAAPSVFEIDIGSPASVSVTGPQAMHDNAPPAGLRATAYDRGGRTRDRTTRATWTSSDPTIASVATSGDNVYVTPHKKGTVNIAAVVYGTVGQLTLTVLGVQTVAVTPTSSPLHSGQTVQLTATPKDVNGGVFTGKTVTWSTSNGSIATVSTSGLVHAVAAGTATISATVDGVVGTATIVVYIPVVTTVTITPPNPSVVIWNPVTLAANPYDQYGATMTGQTATWSSSDSRIVEVSSTSATTAAAQGNVVGQATITATMSGVNGTTTVTSTNPPFAVSIVGTSNSTTTDTVPPNMQCLWMANAANGQEPYAFWWVMNGGNEVGSSDVLYLTNLGQNFTLDVYVTDATGTRVSAHRDVVVSANAMPCNT
jgi:uncharacterized protein YjdB